MQRQHKKNKSKSAKAIVAGSLPVIANPGSHLSARRAVPKIYTFDLPILATQLSVVAGALATTVSIVGTLVSRSATWAALFQEFRIIGARFRLKVTTPFTTPQGYVYVYLNEKLSAAPTGAEAASSPRIEIPCLGVTADKTYAVDWVARDLLDLEFSATSAIGGTTPVYLKAFAANTNAATAGVITMDGALRIQFRGFQ